MGFCGGSGLVCGADNSSCGGAVSVELVDTYREMVMKMRGKRKLVADGLQGTILPSVVKELNRKSKGLRYGEVRATPTIAEISGNGWRHTVDLEKKECSCWRWQIGGKPCTHALHFIFSKGEKVDQYVDDCFSVAKFKAAYEPILMPIRGQSQWPKAQPVFEMIPPKLSRSAGRPRTRRYKNSSEGGGRKHVCKRCGAMGHPKKTCKEPEIDSDADRDVTPLPKRQKSSETATTTTSTPPCTPSKQVTQPFISTSSPMTRLRAAAFANASSPPSASTRSKATTNSPLKQV